MSALRGMQLPAIDAAAMIATIVFTRVAALGLPGPVEETNGRSNFGFMLVAAIFAANMCWLLLRHFALMKARGAT